MHPKSRESSANDYLSKTYKGFYSKKEKQESYEKGYLTYPFLLETSAFNQNLYLKAKRNIERPQSKNTRLAILIR